MFAGGFADRNLADTVRHQSHNLGANQAVVNHDIGLLDQAQRFQRQQFGVSGTGAHQ